MKIDLRVISLILLAGAVALSPSFVVGEIAGGREIEIRSEDILIALFLIFIIIRFFVLKIKKIEKPPLFFPIILWVGFGVFTVLINWLFGKLVLSRGFFYLLKEVEFFIFYFFVFYNVKKIDLAKFLINFWFFLNLINIFYIFYQIAAKKFLGEYGWAAVGEWGVFPTGGFFTIIFIFLINIYLYYFLNSDISFFKKIGFGVLALSPAIGIFGSASQTVFLGAGFSLFLTLFFYFLKNKKNFLLFIFLLILALALILILYVASNNVEFAFRLKRLFSFSDIVKLYLAKRWDNVIVPFFNNFYNSMDIFDLFLGRGIGYLHEAHNQYLRNFMETGVIGSLIFLFLILNILKLSFNSFSKNKEPLSIGLSVGLLTATITMLFFGLATEPFIVVKPSEVYWFFAGLTVAVLRINKKL